MKASPHAAGSRRRRASSAGAALKRLLLAVALAASTLHAQEPRASIRGETSGYLDAGFLEVRRVLRDLEGLGAWFPSIAQWQVLERTADRVRIHGRHDLPWPLRDRDYVVDYRVLEDTNASFVLEARAVSGDLDPRPGVVRLDDLRSQWTLTSRGAGTAVRYEAEGVPAGRLPDWVERASRERENDRLLRALGAEVARRAGARP